MIARKSMFLQFIGNKEGINYAENEFAKRITHSFSSLVTMD
jgi:hypothetical protein